MNLVLARWSLVLPRMAWRSWLPGVLALAGMAVGILAAAQDREGTPAAPALAVARIAPLLRVSGPIGPATDNYLARGLQKAARDRAPLVALQIDTPNCQGHPGFFRAGRGLGGAQRRARGKRGGFIVYASHLAAMAPGTNLGAATPVQIGGLPDKPAPPRAPDDKAGTPQGSPDAVRPETDAMTRKTVNDSAAWLRSLAQMRGRNVEWADRAVRDRASLSAKEAQTQRVIDYIAADLPALLQQAHGRAVQMSDGNPVHPGQQ